MRELAGGVALVTGGARRLGRAFAEALAADGMRLAIHHAASTEEAGAVAAGIRSRGGDAATFQGNLRDADVALSLPDRVAAHFGRLDLLVNSAAVMVRLPVADTSVAAWDEIMDLNLRAPFLLAQQAAPHLKRVGGTIVNIADLGGLEPWRHYPAHSVSKAGVVMLTKVLAMAFAPEITVNAIAPGTVLVPEEYDDARRAFLSETTPLGRLGTPEDAVEALRYLARQQFVTGETLVVDGGRMHRQ